MSVPEFLWARLERNPRLQAPGARAQTQDEVDVMLFGVPRRELFGKDRTELGRIRVRCLREADCGPLYARVDRSRVPYLLARGDGWAFAVAGGGEGGRGGVELGGPFETAAAATAELRARGHALGPVLAYDVRHRPFEGALVHMYSMWLLYLLNGCEMMNITQLRYCLFDET